MSRWQDRVGALLAELRSWQLVALAAALFVVDLALPDPLPFIDEILLGIATLLLARRRSPSG